VSYAAPLDEFDPVRFVPNDDLPESIEEIRLLRAAPIEAQRLFWERMSMQLDPQAAPVPCNWLDLKNLRCRFYAHRPGICRRFEVGGERCIAHRNNVGVQ